MDELMQLALVHGNLTMNPAIVKAWYKYVGIYSCEELTHAFHVVGATCERFPAPAHVIKIIEEMPVPGIPPAKDAYHHLLVEAGNMFPGGPPSNVDDLTRKVISKMKMGVMSFKELTTKQKTWNEKEFVELYQAEVKEIRKENNLRQLAEDEKMEQLRRGQKQIEGAKINELFS